MAAPKKKSKPADDLTLLVEGGVTETGLVRHPQMRVPFHRLNPATYNPRRMTDHARVGLSNTIDRFGMVQPIVWNIKTGNIVGGHQRFEVLAERGEATADVVVVDLDEAEEKLLNIQLNNKDIQGVFVDDKLDQLIADIRGGYEPDEFDSMKSLLALENLIAMTPSEWVSDFDETGGVGAPEDGEGRDAIDDMEETSAPALSIVRVQCPSKDLPKVRDAMQAAITKLKLADVSLLER